MLLGSGPLAGCEAAPGPELAPPSATPLRERGAFDLALADCEAALATTVARAHGALRFQRYRVAADTGFGALADWYAQRLGSRWEPLGGVPERQRGFQVRGWQRRATIGPTPVLCVALLDEPALDGSGAPMRLVIVGATRSG